TYDVPAALDVLGGGDHVLHHADLGHVVGAGSAGSEKQVSGELIPDGFVCANGARDCGRGRGRGIAAGVAGFPALELGGDAAVGPGCGNDSEIECVACRGRGRRRGRRVGRGRAGRGGEQPAAGRRYGDGRGGQRLPETWHELSSSPRRLLAGNNHRQPRGRLGGHGRRASGAAAPAPAAAPAIKDDDRAAGVHRVGSCEDDPSRGKDYHRVHEKLPLAPRTARLNIVGVGRRGSAFQVGIYDAPAIEHVLYLGDPGQVAVAGGIGVENNCPGGSCGVGRDQGQGAGDYGRGRGRVTVTAVGVAGIPALELG